MEMNNIEYYYTKIKNHFSNFNNKITYEMIFYVSTYILIYIMIFIAINSINYLKY